MTSPIRWSWIESTTHYEIVLKERDGGASCWLCIIWTWINTSCIGEVGTALACLDLSQQSILNSITSFEAGLLKHYEGVSFWFATISVMPNVIGISESFACFAVCLSSRNQLKSITDLGISLKERELKASYGFGGNIVSDKPQLYFWGCRKLYYLSSFRAKAGYVSHRC